MDKSFSANNNLLDVVAMALQHFNGKTKQQSQHSFDLFG